METEMEMEWKHNVNIMETEWERNGNIMKKQNRNRIEME